MTSPIGGPSNQSLSLSMNRMDSIQSRLNNLDLGTNVTKSASELIDSIKSGMGKKFSFDSLKSVNELFDAFYAKLETEHPDLLMEVLDLMRKSGFADPQTGSDPNFQIIDSNRPVSDAHIGQLMGLHALAFTQTKFIPGTGNDDTADNESGASAISGQHPSMDPLSRFAHPQAPPPVEDTQTSQEMMSKAQSGDFGAIAAMREMNEISEEDQQNNTSPVGQMLATIQAIRQLMFQAVQSPGTLSGQNVGAVASASIARGIVDWINQGNRAGKRLAAPPSSEKEKEINLAIHKVQEQLIDGIDSLEELAEITGILSQIPNIAIIMPALLDSIREAVMQFLEEQLGQLSGDDARQLLTTINQLMGTATGGTEVFSDDEIDAIVELFEEYANGGAMIEEESDADMLGQVVADDSTTQEATLSSFGDSGSALGAAIAASTGSPKKLDLNFMMATSSAASATGKVAASSESSGDSSSDRNAAMRKVGKIVEFLEKLCETGLDQVMDQLTQKLKQAGMGDLLKGTI